MAHAALPTRRFWRSRRQHGRPSHSASSRPEAVVDGDTLSISTGRIPAEASSFRSRVRPVESSPGPARCSREHPEPFELASELTDLNPVVTTQLTDSQTPANTEVSLVIGGMTCGACAARIERRLNRLEDVEASVNYASERARVTLPAHMPVQEVVDEVRSVGYTAEPVQDGSKAEPADDDLEAREPGRSAGGWW